MKTRIFSQIEIVLKDRLLLFLSVLIILLAICFIAYVGVSIHPSDIQLRTRYSAFGTLHFYRTSWYYLFSFVLFGLVALVVHVILLAKLSLQGMRPLAVLYGWFSVAFLVIAILLTHSVISLAALQ